MTKSYSLNAIVAVLGVLAMVFAFTPLSASASPWWWGWGDDDVTVTNNNDAVVLNGVIASSDTGGNGAGGARGGNGGDGGDIDNDGDDVDDSTTGNGGNGGHANGVDSGGLVSTGNAGANAGVLNVVNSNATSVNRCGCDREGGNGDVTVRNQNRAFVGNLVVADADTGDNWAGGARGGNGGNAGDIDNYEGDDVDDSTTGNGGHGGAGGEGGTVYTGYALADAGAVNVVNTNLTRVRR